MPHNRIAGPRLALETCMLIHSVDAETDRECRASAMPVGISCVKSSRWGGARRQTSPTPHPRMSRGVIERGRGTGRSRVKRRSSLWNNGRN